jgi:hypothetical protein
MSLAQGVNSPSRLRRAGTVAGRATVTVADHPSGHEEIGDRRTDSDSRLLAHLSRLSRDAWAARRITRQHAAAAFQ